MHHDFRQPLSVPRILAVVSVGECGGLALVTPDLFPGSLGMLQEIGIPCLQKRQAHVDCLENRFPIPIPVCPPCQCLPLANWVNFGFRQTTVELEKLSLANLNTLE
jgi:hypothetical protein